MDNTNYEIIKTMYNDLKIDQKNMTDNLNIIKKEISEIEKYLNSLLNKEESDFSVFSPRKAEDVFHDDIEKNRKKRDALVLQCDELEKQIYLRGSRIVQLEKIMSDSSMLHVKQLSILDAQEKERLRIARDLHDTSLQNLTHLVHKVELSTLYIDEDPIQAKLELATVEKGIRKVIDEIRNTIFDLRPMSIDDLGLDETINKLLLMLNADQKLHIMTDIDKLVLDPSDPSMHLLFITIYRIIQESVQNSIKHSGCNEIFIKVKNYEKEYLISIKDNGKGFDLEEAMKKEKHFGLSVIKERVLFLGGIINIDTKQGTLIEIRIPKNNY